MVYLTLINFLIVTSIFGYSFLFKKIILKDKNISVSNLDFFYGLIFLYLISLLFHFFIPLGKISELIIVIGLFFLIYCSLKKKLNISLIKYFVVIFVFSIVAYYGRDNIDSPLYHLQIVKWLTDHKITFGLANLEWRFGVNYPWYSIVSLLNIDLSDFSNKYYISIVIFSFFFYEILDEKKIEKSKIFLSLTFSYLLIFSFIHPFNYGVVLNHIGNPEKDLFNMLLFISLIYIYLKIFDTSSVENKNNLISILMICLAFIVMQTTIYIFIIIPFIFIFIKFVKIKDHKKIIIILFSIIILWVFKSFANSGCLIFQIPQTCLSTDWTIDLSTLKFHLDETKRYSRSLPSLEMINDTHKTLETFLWFKFWFKNYFLNAALHQINSVIIFFSCIFGLYLFIKKKLNLTKNDLILIVSILIVNITCTILIPEIRYYWGPHISLSVLILSLIIISINYFRQNFFYIYIPIFSFLLFFSFKVYPMIKFSDFVKLPNRNHSFSGKEKIGVFDGFEIYTNNWKCADMQEICVNIPKKNYSFKYKYGFLIIN